MALKEVQGHRAGSNVTAKATNHILKSCWFLDGLLKICFDSTTRLDFDAGTVERNFVACVTQVAKLNDHSGRFLAFRLVVL